MYRAASHKLATALCACVVVLGVSVAAFSEGDPVPIVANKVGPYTNPSETYRYYSLPYCPPVNMKGQSQELGDVLSGDRRVNTPYNLRFKANVPLETLCTRKLSLSDFEKFAYACEEDYYFEMFVDDLPLYGYIGEHEHEDMILGHTEVSRHYLYTHLHFAISYNGDKIVAANVTTDRTRRLDITDPEDGKPVSFTYSVEWIPSTDSYDTRMERYTKGLFLPASMEIHWLSITNSLILVILLTAFLAIILMRIVKNDFTRYMREQEAEDGDVTAEEETGWKLVYGDVFRFPSNSNFLSAAVGAGAHLFAMTLVLLTLFVSGYEVHSRRGSVMTSFLIIYALTAWVGGFVGARLYKQLGGKPWVWNTVLTASLFPIPFAVTFVVLNFIAVAHSSTAALPIGTIFVVITLYVFVAFPLTILGAIAGKRTRGFEAPCRTLKVPRQIPPVLWYRSAAVQALVAGFLPFSAISIELHYIFAAVWGRKVYTLFGMLYIAFVLLTIVTSCIVIAVTYFQLTAEDYRWWWRSFVSGGAAGFFIYAYCLYYYVNHSEMYGVLQTSFFFGYMAMASFAVFLMLGCVGFLSALKFVKKIYSSIKVE